MAITISGDTPNFSAATITTVTSTTLSDGTNSTSSTNPILGSAKAWINYKGTATVSIRGSYNVSSVTVNGTGDYTVNFTTAFSNTNYAGVITSASDNAAPSTANTSRAPFINNLATGSARMGTSNALGNAADFLNIYAVFFGT